MTKREKALEAAVRDLMQCLDATELGWKRRYNTASCTSTLNANDSARALGLRALNMPKE